MPRLHHTSATTRWVLVARPMSAGSDIGHEGFLSKVPGANRVEIPIGLVLEGCTTELINDPNIEGGKPCAALQPHSSRNRKPFRAASRGRPAGVGGENNAAERT